MAEGYFPTQAHEMPGLGRVQAERALAALNDFAAENADKNKPLWMLAGLHAAIVEMERMRGAYVEIAREQGFPWSDIGAALGGITKQAAQQKYGR